MSTYPIHDSGNVVTNGASLQSRLNNVVGGDIIVLDANVEYYGPIQLPNLPLSSPVIIQSASIGSLPAGIRVQPSQRNLMPKITCPNTGTNAAALWTADGAKNWTLQGIEFRMSALLAGNTVFGLVWCGNNGVSGPYQTAQTLSSQMPSFIKFDRCSFWSGFPGPDDKSNGQMIQQGIQMHGANLTWTECDIRDFKNIGKDCQAMTNLNGTGPWFIINCYVEGATENIIWGGGIPAWDTNVSQFYYKEGTIIQYNWFRKAPNWQPLNPAFDGSIWAVKNIFELKNANNAFFNGTGQVNPGTANFLIDNNTFENCWQAVDQVGHGIVLTPRSTGSNQGFSNASITNIKITNNHFVHIQRWFEVTGVDTNGGGYPTYGVTVQDNVVDDCWSYLSDPNIWTLDLLTNYSGGTFTLTYNDLTLFPGGAGHTATPVTTGSIAWSGNITTLASNIQTALNTLASVNGASICTGSGNVVTIDFEKNKATFGNLTINTAGLTGAGPAILTPPHTGCGYVQVLTTDSTTGLQNPGTNRVFRPQQLSSNSGQTYAIVPGTKLILDWASRSNDQHYNPGWEMVCVKSITLDANSPSSDPQHNATGTFTCDTMKAHSGTTGGGILIGGYSAQSGAPWLVFQQAGGQATGGFGTGGNTTGDGQTTPINSTTNVVVSHNTIKPWPAAGDYALSFAQGSDGVNKAKGFKWNDNIFPIGKYLMRVDAGSGIGLGYGFHDTSGGNGNTGLAQQLANDCQIKNNGIYNTLNADVQTGLTHGQGGLLTAPAGFSYSGDPNNYYPDSTGVVFQNYAAGGAGLALAAGSPLKGKATDNTDIGSRNFTWYTDGNGPPSTQKATNTNVSASANPSITGNAVTWTASVTSTSPGTLTGTVQFKIDGSNFGSGVTLSSGAATSISQTPAAGTHTITAVYSGDANFLTSTGTLTQTVASTVSTTTTISSSQNPIGTGLGITWTGTVVPGDSGTPTGTIQFKVDNVNFGAAVAISGGTATSGSDSALGAGDHSIAAVYSGDGTYATSTGSLTQTVSAPIVNTSSVAVVGNPNPSTAGQAVSWTATITGFISPINKVNFETGDFSQCAAHTGGSIVTSPKLSGTYCCQLLRNQSIANVEIRQGVSAYYSLPTAFYSFIFRYTGTLSSEAGICNFLDTASQYKSALHLDAQGHILVYGHSALLFTSNTILKPDTNYTIGFYLGTGASTATWGLRINGAVETDGAVNVDLGTVNNGAILLGGGSPYTSNFYFDDVQMSSIAIPGPGGSPTGNIQFALDGTNFGSPVNSFQGHSTSITQTPTAGNHTITAVYVGDSTFSGSTGSVVHAVAAVQATTTQLTASPNPAKTGQNVTFTATVQPATSGTPTGTVQFKDGGGNLGSAQALSGGVASLITSALSIAAHTITAVYSGDSNFNASTSSALVQSVLSLAPSTTTVSSSATPSQPNVGVSWTATVSGTGGTPTGTVQFTVDGSNFGSAVTLSGGVATSGSNTSLGAGSHAITAVYSGDAGFSGSTGLFTQAVIAVQPVTPGGGGAAIVLANAVSINSSGVGTATTNLKGFSDLIVQFQITAVPAGGNPTLDLYLQTSIDQGLTWIDMAHTQFKSTVATRFAQIVGDFVASENIRSASDGQLQGERVIQGPWGDQLRLKWVFAAGGSSGSYTLSSVGFAKGSQGQN